MDARYRFSAEKAAAAIHWMVSQGRSVDLHTALKGFYFADKSFLNAQYRPIFGATYRAMKYGPVPLEPYEMMKGENLYLQELDLQETPWRLDGYTLSARRNDEPDMSVFSAAERDHLRRGFERSKSMTFTVRTAATHGSDWQQARGGVMRYEDMLDPEHRTPRIIDYMQDSAATIRL